MAQAQRVEVVTSVERRRRFTDDDKMRFIDEALAPGGSMRAVADRHGIDRRLLYTWKSRFKRDGLLALRPATTAAADVAGESAFVRVDTVQHDDMQLIRVHVDEQIVVDFPVGVDPRRLAAVIALLKA